MAAFGLGRALWLLIYMQKILPSFCHSKAMHEKYLLLNLEVNYSCSSVPRAPWYLQQMGYKPQLSRVHTAGLMNFPFEMTLVSQPKITPHDGDGASLSVLDRLQNPHQLSLMFKGHPLF